MVEAPNTVTVTGPLLVVTVMMSSSSSRRVRFETSGPGRIASDSQVGQSRRATSKTSRSFHSNRLGVDQPQNRGVLVADGQRAGIPTHQPDARCYKRGAAGVMSTQPRP